VSWNPIVWLEYIVSAILIGFHTALSTVVDPASGAAWGLSIVGLVIVIRIVLIPLFVKQIKSQRNLQILQPQMKEIQTKYAGDREKQSQELMKLYKDTGTNPLSSCFPILAQAPIFFALFQVLQGIAMGQTKGLMTPELVEQARQASILGAPISATFMDAAQFAVEPFLADPQRIRVVTIILIILMTATTFITQRQLIVKNTAPDNPMVRQQKILLYVFPFIFAVTGVNFPIGVLIYWLTTNLWSMGQQFYVIRNSPQPGTPAFEALEERKAAKEARRRARRGEPEPESTIPVVPPVKGATVATRQQPKKQSKAKRAAAGAAGTAGVATASGAAASAAPDSNGASGSNGTNPGDEPIGESTDVTPAGSATESAS